MEYIELVGENSRTWMSVYDMVEFARKGNVIKVLYRGSNDFVNHEFANEEEAMKVYYALLEKKNGAASNENLDKLLRNYSDLSPRARKACERAGIKTIGDLVKYPPSDILNIRNAGRGTRRELLKFLHDHGLKSDYE